MASAGNFEEHYTLSAINAGKCTFRLAWADSFDRDFSFDEYEESGGLVISIPIEVDGTSVDQV